MTILRRNLLASVRVALAPAQQSTIRERLAELGATVEAADGAAVTMLVFDSRPPFGDGAEDGLRAALDAAWSSIHEIAAAALIPSPEPSKIVLIAPAVSAGPHAAAARAGLENLARTLSVEWARYRITTTAILPGEHTTEQELAELMSFLASAAGDYFSGCRLELGAVSPAAPR